MLIDRQREKLIQAIVYFARHTRKCGKTKLFKLLYFLDFEHYRQIGRSVTGLQYFAWPMGPVPQELYGEMDVPAEDMAEHVDFREVRLNHGAMLKPVPKTEFDPAPFSKRELEILESLATEYRDATADEMVERTHLETLPWHRVFTVEGRKQGAIPYEYALSNQEKDAMKQLIRENEEMVRNYS